MSTNLDLPNVDASLFQQPDLQLLLPATRVTHAPRILLLYGSLRERSYSRLVTEEAARLLDAMGHGVGEVTGRSGDGGIDCVIYEDRLKLDRIYLQAKRWADAPVGGPDINGFLGALAKHGANRGVFVTTSRFTQDARRAVELPHLRLVLIDGEELARLAVEHNVGVSVKRRIELKRFDTDFFDDL